MATWREMARATIDRVMAQHKDARNDDLRQLLIGAYPFDKRNRAAGIYFAEMEKAIKHRNDTENRKRIIITSKALESFWTNKGG